MEVSGKKQEIGIAMRPIKGWHDGQSAIQEEGW